MSRYLVGIDVGGTFTDFVAYDRDSGTIVVWKNLTTPADPTDGILDGLARIGDRTRHQPYAARHDRRHQRHPGAQGGDGRLLSRPAASATCPSSSAATAKSHYDITWIKPKPLVKHRHCYELDERIDRDGVVLEPLDEVGLRRIVRGS